jgi:hypothetical protein
MQGGACARMWIVDTVLECRSNGGTKRETWISV